MSEPVVGNVYHQFIIMTAPKSIVTVKIGLCDFYHDVGFRTGLAPHSMFSVLTHTRSPLSFSLWTDVHTGEHMDMSAHTCLPVCMG